MFVYDFFFDFEHLNCVKNTFDFFKRIELPSNAQEEDNFKKKCQKLQKKYKLNLYTMKNLQKTQFVTPQLLYKKK